MSTPVTVPPNRSAAPTAILLGAGLLIAFTIVAIAVGRTTGIGRDRMPAITAEASRDLRFADRADGGVMVYEGAAREAFSTLEPGTDGFVRGVLRSLARERRASGLDSAAAFRLRRDHAAHLYIEDLATGRQIALDAFGHTNAAAFARLLPAPEGAS